MLDAKMSSEDFGRELRNDRSHVCDGESKCHDTELHYSYGYSNNQYCVELEADPPGERSN